MFGIVNSSAASIAMIDFSFWDFVSKSTIAVAVAALACVFLRRQSAAIRHRLWLFGLAAPLVAPMMSLFLPKFTLHVLPAAVPFSRVSAVQVCP